MFFLSPHCSINGCFCDKDCHNVGDCCSDIAEIGCHPVNRSSPTPTPTNILGKKKQEFIEYISQSYF